MTISVLTGTDVAGAKQTPMDKDSDQSDATDREAQQMIASLQEQKRLQKQDKEEAEEDVECDETLQELAKLYSKYTY